MTVEEGGTGIVRNEINFDTPIGIEPNRILHDARCCYAIDADKLRTMPMEMDWMAVTARIVECQAVAISPLHFEGRGVRKGPAVDRPPFCIGAVVDDLLKNHRKCAFRNRMTGCAFWLPNKR